MDLDDNENFIIHPVLVAGKLDPWHAIELSFIPVLEVLEPVSVLLRKISSVAFGGSRDGGSSSREKALFGTSTGR